MYTPILYDLYNNFIISGGIGIARTRSHLTEPK